MADNPFSKFAVRCFKKIARHAMGARAGEQAIKNPPKGRVGNLQQCPESTSRDKTGI